MNAKLLIICSAVVLLVCAEVSADIFEIAPEQFDTDAVVVDFETGSTGLPSVPGLEFLSEGAVNSPDWFASSGNFDGFFDVQGWSNLVSSAYSNMGVEFTTPVEAFGGWFGRIENFTNEHAGQIEVRIYDQDSILVGSPTIPLIPEFDSPVWIGYGSDTLVSRVEFRVNQFPDSGFFSGDNLTFGSVVPEPSSTGIVLLTLGFCMGRRRAPHFSTAVNTTSSTFTS